MTALTVAAFMHQVEPPRHKTTPPPAFCCVRARPRSAKETYQPTSKPKGRLGKVRIVSRLFACNVRRQSNSNLAVQSAIRSGSAERAQQGEVRAYNWNADGRRAQCWPYVLRARHRRELLPDALQQSAEVDDFRLGTRRRAR